MQQAVGQRVGEEFEHLHRHRDPDALGLGLEDAEAQLVGRGMDVGDEAHRQAAEQARLHPVQRLRGAVGGEDQPLAFGQQRIDRVEQLFLRGGLANDELDIVNQKKILKLLK